MYENYRTYTRTTNGVKETNTTYNVGNVYTKDSTYEYKSGKLVHLINTEDENTGATREYKETFLNGNLTELIDMTYDDKEDGGQ